MWRDCIKFRNTARISVGVDGCGLSASTWIHLVLIFFESMVHFRGQRKLGVANNDSVRGVDYSAIFPHNDK